MHAGVHTTRQYKNGSLVSHEEITEIEYTVHTPESEKTAYWKSKGGKFRKAGKTKARTGETLIYLTKEEENDISTT